MAFRTEVSQWFKQGVSAFMSDMPPQPPYAPQDQAHVDWIEGYDFAAKIYAVKELIDGMRN